MADLPPKLTFFVIRKIKSPPKLSFFVICQIKFPPKLLFLAIQQICFGFRKLSSSIYHTVDYRYFEHRAISNKILKNMKRQRMRDKNSSLFISLLKLVNFNNTFAPLLYFKLCQDTAGKNVSFDLPKFNVCVIRQIKFVAKFNFFVIRQNFFPPKFLLVRSCIYNHYALFIIIA